jgi:hypothetical protein
MRKPIGFLFAALWAWSATFAYGAFMRWSLGPVHPFALIWPSAVALVVVKLSSRAAGLIAPDSRALASAFFLSSAGLLFLIDQTTVYLFVAVVWLLWQGGRLWATAGAMKPLIAELGLDKAGMKTFVHAMMLADTVGSMAPKG